MTELYVHEEKADSMFDILGEDENSLTASLGWALKRSKTLLKKIVDQFYREHYAFEKNEIHLQKSGEDAGFTDMEILVDNDIFFIVEAKKGWQLPSKKQLKRYRPRLRETAAKHKFILVISECSPDRAKHELSPQIYRTNIKYLSWTQIYGIIDNALVRCKRNEKETLRELKEYLKRVIEMRDASSNLVWVVALNNSSNKKWGGRSGIDIVNAGWYNYPAAKGWPKSPPNYMGFRYNGRLQSIHHVEKYELGENLHKKIPWIPDKHDRLHFLIKLGPKIEPHRDIPSGKVFSSQHHWCAIDLLFTAKTVKDAAAETRKRRSRE